MRPGEVLVVRLSAGPTIVRFLNESDHQVSVSTGRNRQARIPPDRVLFQTGLVMSDEQEVEGLRRQCESLAPDIDLGDVWDVAVDDPGPLTLDDVSELYWGRAADTVRRVALALHLESTDFFSGGEGGFTARSREAVEEIRARRLREAQVADAAESLMTALAEGSLPQPITPDHDAHLRHLREYAIFGDDYVRSHAARRLLDLAPGAGDPQRHCFELLAGAGVFSADEPLELHRAEIVTAVPQDALSEAVGIHAGPLLADPRRVDMMEPPSFTIDDADALDRDDAISLRILEPGGPAQDQRYSVGVHITDAGALIPAGGAIDLEADRRMGTLYLPDGNIHMLPPELVRSAGSLDPGQARAAVSLIAQLDATGAVLDWQVLPSIVRSDDAIAYGEVAHGLEDPGDPRHRTLVQLSGLAVALKLRRKTAGAMDIQRSEMSVKVSESGHVEVSVLQRPEPARELVAELMILCNSLLAAYCSSNQIPAVYRGQAAPDPEGTAAAMDAPEGPLRRFLLLRQLRPADIGIVPAHHSGLGVETYIQATSPLRRYPDLVMQRQVSHYLNEGRPLYSDDEIASLAQRSEVQVKELGQLEEQRKRYWFLKYLRQTHLEQPHRSLLQAVVLENLPRRHALLEMADYPFRVRAEVPQSIDPGERVDLKLHGVDLWRRIASLVYVERSA